MNQKAKMVGALYLCLTDCCIFATADITRSSRYLLPRTVIGRCQGVLTLPQSSRAVRKCVRACISPCACLYVCVCSLVCPLKVRRPVENPCLDRLTPVESLARDIRLQVK